MPDPSASTFKTILLRIEDGIATITLNRPDKRNAMSPVLHHEMTEVLARLRTDDAVRCLVITGAGDAFCAGMDLKEYFIALKDDPAEYKRVWNQAVEWRARTLRHYPKPTIAMINGFCFGGAFSLVEGCDLALAAEDATFGLSEINFKLFPGGCVSKSLANLLRPRDALWYGMTGRPFDGIEAARIGFINQAVPRAELLSETMQLAAELAAEGQPRHGRHQGGLPPVPRHELGGRDGLCLRQGAGADPAPGRRLQEGGHRRLPAGQVQARPGKPRRPAVAHRTTGCTTGNNPATEQGDRSMSQVTRRQALAMTAAAAGPLLLPRPGWSQAARPVRVGVLNDQGGVFSDSSGPGSSIAAQLAAEDAMATLGMKVEIVSADHQNKADVGSAIARDWFDRGGVDAIADLGNSSVALAVSTIAREKDKACLISAGGTTLLTGAQCAPTTVHWTYDTYAETTALAKALTDAGRSTWFFITVDYAFGQSLQDETTRALARMGGKVVGSVRHPINTTDFSAYLLQAQASGAQVIALANGGDDTNRCVKQASEFGLGAKQTLVGLAMLITDVHAIGLDAAQGLFVTEAFYWDLNDRTRAFAKRWSERSRGREPTMMQAGVYGVVLDYLKAVHALSGDAASGTRVVRRMKAAPADDDAFGRSTVRADGRAVHDNYVFQVKAPAQSRGAWDYYRLVTTVPGETAFRAMADGGCPLLPELIKG